ncbi:MAG TPA: GNAT family N-acetyltransferase [Vicinamibacteria bacterium]|nr:GNAT family N-acetyltransferase [Vicinamibacteria bacterium]
MIESLFDRHIELRAVLEAVLEGRVGRVESEGDPPRVARLTVGCYHFFGGDPSLPEARRFVDTAAAPRELVYGKDPAWRRLILDVYGPCVSDRPMQTFDPSRLSTPALQRMEGALPEGFELRRFDAALATQLDRELEPHALQVYTSAAAFAESGIGYGAIKEGRLACAATSYTVSSRGVEIAIATRPEFRGLGLAAAASARLMRHCLESGLVPHWSASNPVSQRLAARLGYGPGGVCEILYLVSED